MDDLPYRSPVRGALKNDQPETADERDVATLVQVRDILKAHLDGLSAFDTFDKSLTKEQLWLEVQARQKSHSVTEPLYQAVSTIVDKIYKQKG